MASFESQHPQRVRARRRLVVAFAAGCCLLAWEPIAVAPAQAGHGRAVPTSTSTSGTTNATSGKEGVASAEDCCASAPPESGSATLVAQPEVSAAKQPRRSQAKAGGTRARRHGTPNATGQTSAQSVPAASGQSEASARRKKEKTEGKKENKGGGKKEKTGGKGKSVSEPPTASGSKSDKSTVDANVVASAAAVESDAPASTPSTASAAAPTAVAPTPLSPGGKPAVNKRSGGKAGRAGRARARVAAARASTAPALAAASVSPALASTLPKSGTGGKSAAAKRRRAQAGLAPLVTTVTKIVGVVPLAVRILIGVLAALALALAVRSRLAARRTRRLEHQRGQLLEDVGLLQAALLPAPPARLGPVGTSVAYCPADGPGAGGDFYDVFALEDGQVAVIVGDVSGHGRGALPHTALLRFTIRAYLEAGLAPRRALQTAGSVLERQLGGSFATVVAATYHPRERTLTYACGGHPPPVVLGSAAAGGDAHAAQLVPVTACSSPPIGAGMKTGMRQTVVSVPGPAQICFHTDGVTEARIAGELYGEERLARGLRGLGPEATASALLDRIAEEADARPDDMAACLLRIEDGAGAPSILREELELDEEVAAAERTEQFLDACGVEPWEVSEVMQSARSDAPRRDPLTIELRYADGLPEVALRHDNVLHSAALVAAGGSRVSR
jgi:serine phosphatase RsbU (regulator of sigma subunit)